MDLKLLRHFVVIAEEGSISAACRKLRLSQPALSQQLRQLERMVRVPVFVRGPRGMELTAAGEALLEPARAVLSKVHEAIEAARLASSEVGGQLRIGILHHGAAELTAPILRAFQESHPRIELIVTPVLITELESDLLEHRSDIAVQYLPITSPQLRADPLFDEPRVLLTSAHHQFQGALGVTVADFLATPTIKASAHAPAAWSNFWSFADLRDGTVPECRQEFDNVHAAMMFTSVSDDISIPVPASGSRFAAFGGLKVVPLTNAPPCTAAVVSRASDRRPEVQAFRQVAIETAKRLLFMVEQATCPA